MSEKRDLWVPAVLLLGGGALCVWHFLARDGSGVLGLAALAVGIVGSLACLPVRIRRGQAETVFFGLGVAVLLLALWPGRGLSAARAAAFGIAALAFLVRLPTRSLSVRKVLLGTAALLALAALVGLLLGTHRDLVWLFSAGALFMAVQVLRTRVVEEAPPPVGPRVCIYGGSFDPFHSGHRALCEAALRANDRLLVVVAGSAPHKLVGEGGDESGPDRTPFHHRVAMTRLGVEGLPRTEVLEMEGRRAGPSYTVDTLEVLRGSYPAGTRFRLLVGADMLHDFPSWREWQRILEMVTLMVAGRPGYELERPEALEMVRGEDGEPIEILVLDVPPDEASSSAIRSALAAGESAGDALSTSVRNYIDTHGLYRG